MKHTSVRTIFLLLLASMIWGSAFVAQSVGMDYVGPFTFLAARSYLGFAVLAAFLVFRDRHQGFGFGKKPAPALLWGSICCGTALFGASILQQIGIQFTTVGKAGFLTSLYVILVPFLALLVFRRTLPGQLWVCAGLSLAGMYLLCLTGPVGFTRGDWLILLCAVGFAVQILVIDRFAPMTDPVKLSCGQFLVVALLSTLPALVLERPGPAVLAQAWTSIAYAGILSSGVAYTLQVVAQRDCDPTVCSLVMCLESVFSALFGWLLLGQVLSLREALGCALMFAAIVLSQLPLTRVPPEKQGESCTK